MRKSGWSPGRCVEKLEQLLRESKAKRSTWRRILGFLEDVKIKETEPRVEPLSEVEFRKLYEAAEDIQLGAIISAL